MYELTLNDMLLSISILLLILYISSLRHSPQRKRQKKRHLRSTRKLLRTKTNDWNLIKFKFFWLLEYAKDMFTISIEWARILIFKKVSLVVDVLSQCHASIHQNFKKKNQIKSTNWLEDIILTKLWYILHSSIWLRINKIATSSR